MDPLIYHYLPRLFNLQHSSSISKTVYQLDIEVRLQEDHNLGMTKPMGIQKYKNCWSIPQVEFFNVGGSIMITPFVAGGLDIVYF